MHKLPDFRLDEYVGLLAALREHGYSIHPVTEMKQRADSRRVFLRHDVDILPSAAVTMGEKEAEVGYCATYYLRLSGRYNLFDVENRRVLRRLAEMGHELGLHYDLELYPADARRGEAELAREVTILEHACGRRIDTISMHNPSLGRADRFRSSDKYVNPRDPRWQAGLLYVSDSCRTWRDESLLACFLEEPPQGLLLLTHPELWLDGTIQDRLEYLERVVLTRVVAADQEHFQRVSERWREHAGASQHDERKHAGGHLGKGSK